MRDGRGDAAHAALDIEVSLLLQSLEQCFRISIKDDSNNKIRFR